MASKRIKKEAYMGRVLIGLGLILKLIQIIGKAFDWVKTDGTVMTLTTTCFLVGGLFVYAFEKRSMVSVFAAACAVSIIGGVLFAAEYTPALVFLMINFISFALMLISSGRKNRLFFGLAVIVLSILTLLQGLSVISMGTASATVVLTSIYLAMGIGLFL